MRKVVILIILGISILLCYQIVVEGFSGSNNFLIPNYTKIETSSKRIDTLISKIININEKEYEKKKTELEKAIKEYQNTKEEYEELQAIVQENEGLDTSLVDMYDVDFLWTIIGNYATEEGISLRFDVTKSLTSIVSSSDYIMCDLNFTVAGEYIALTDFIYDLEDDSRLGFEISNFTMQNGEQNLQATFTVREVPINNKNLSSISNSPNTINTNANTNVNVVNSQNTVKANNTVQSNNTVKQ